MSVPNNSPCTHACALYYIRRRCDFFVNKSYRDDITMITQSYNNNQNGSSCIQHIGIVLAIKLLFFLSSRSP